MTPPREESNRKKQIEQLRSEYEQAREQMNRLESNEPFVIVFCGAFSTGKTSLINALVGCDLPTGVNPVTKCATKLSYGKKETVFLEHIQTGKRCQVSKQQAEAFIRGEAFLNKADEYRVLYLFPSALLKRGLVFMDTPGLNDDVTGKLDDISREEIAQADYCFVTFAANHFGDKQYEKPLLADLQRTMGGNFSVIVNYINTLHSLKDYADLASHVRYILTGNDEVALEPGKLFMVDLRPDVSDLDGLDVWLNTKLLRDMQTLREITVCSRVHTTIETNLALGEKLYAEMQNQIDTLIKARNKKIETEIRKLITESRSPVQKFRMLQDKTLRELTPIAQELIMLRLSHLEPGKFNDCAFKEIEKALEQVCKRIHIMVTEQFPALGLIDPAIYLDGTEVRYTKRIVNSKKRSLLDPNRFLLGATEYYSNDYLEESLKDQVNVTIPSFRRRINAYFYAMEDVLISSLSEKTIASDYSKIGDLLYDTELICDSLLNYGELKNRLEKKKRSALNKAEA